jgi:hypothetical protein
MLENGYPFHFMHILEDECVQSLAKKKVSYSSEVVITSTAIVLVDVPTYHKCKNNYTLIVDHTYNIDIPYVTSSCLPPMQLCGELFKLFPTNGIYHVYSKFITSVDGDLDSKSLEYNSVTEEKETNKREYCHMYNNITYIPVWRGEYTIKEKFRAYKPKKVVRPSSLTLTEKVVKTVTKTISNSEYSINDEKIKKEKSDLDDSIFDKLFRIVDK